MFLDNAMERINRLILQGGRTGMTENQFFAAEIKEWKNSQRRKDQVMGDLYYEDSMTFFSVSAHSLVKTVNFRW